VLAGKAGGSVTLGRYLQLADAVPHSNLWVGCMNAMGLDVSTFGDPNFCTGALDLG